MGSLKAANNGDLIPQHLRHLVVPGQVIINSNDGEDGGYLRGHGTYIDNITEDGENHSDQRLVASLAGTIERVNKLVTVRPYASAPYNGQVGDLVIGRIVSVQSGSGRWKVALGSTRESVLPLSGVNLPGGVQRMRTAEDALEMRNLYQEGDLVCAEVQHADGVCTLHTRSLRYGRLENGCLVKVPAGLVPRMAQHCVTLVPPDGGLDGVEGVLGTNGHIWIQRAITSHDSSSNGVEDMRLAETLQRSRDQHLETPVLPEERENIARVRASILALAMVFHRITPDTIMALYHLSIMKEVSVSKMSQPSCVLAMTEGLRRNNLN